MHENRETSETPAANQQQDDGDGLGRKARMNVPEESDSGIVPMNHSNKIEQSIAESEEERPLIKEKHPSVQHAPDTERGLPQGSVISPLLPTSISTREQIGLAITRQAPPFAMLLMGLRRRLG